MAFRSVPDSARRGGRDDVRVVESTKAGLAMRFPSPTRFLANRRGNVAMMYALILPVLMFGAGFAIDYTHAMQVQTKLDAAADAAVLAALTPSMMQQSNATAQTAATDLFTAQANAQGSLVAADTVVSVTVTNPTGSPLVRNVTVSYTAANTNIFAGVLGYSALGITGSSTAKASSAANTNFYLLLDNSPSMALPATQAGINSMVSLTPDQGGCAFACHQGSTGNGDTYGNPCLKGTTYSTPTVSAGGYSNALCSSTQGTQLDDYAVARRNTIQLRLDALNTGVGDLTAYAEQFRTQQAANPPTYQFAAYSMDTLWQIGMVNTTTVATSSTPTNEIMALTTNYVSGWSTASANFGVMEYYDNNNECGNVACTTNGGGGDYATEYDNALGAMNTIMPNPGQGTNTAGDTPKELLFFVTDGVEDENNAPSCSEPLSGTRCQSPINPSLCTTIKNRGISIAVLYTDYYPVTSNTWYNDWIAPFNPVVTPPAQTPIATELQDCASPGKFFDAAVGTNLGTALESLFSNAMAAHLTQ